MTWEELSLMNQSKSTTIGAHTILHPSLASLNYNEQFNEILGSKSVLENSLHTEISLFSYPFGTKSDYNHDTIDICRNNFKYAFSNFRGIVNEHSYSLELPRYIVRNWNKKTFVNELAKFYK
jgi:peptidoglycan/xylan/chitin deacetylase (PgdA/CDA1 family)